VCGIAANVRGDSDSAAAALVFIATTILHLVRKICAMTTMAHTNTQRCCRWQYRRERKIKAGLLCIWCKPAEVRRKAASDNPFPFAQCPLSNVVVRYLFCEIL
jgi:hypothetical protein